MMDRAPKFLFLHGLESGPHGSKYQALVNAGFEVTSPDLRGKSLRERVVVAQTLMAQDDYIVVGSSFGGITAALAASSGARALGYLLCAPSLENEQSWLPQEQLATLPNALILHGVSDDVVPIEVSRKYAARTGTPLIEVEDGHRLSKHLSKIIEVANLLVASMVA